MKSLHYYRESWWKVPEEPIWYLAGKYFDMHAGRWYIGDTIDDLSGPYDSREKAEAALKE